VIALIDYGAGDLAAMRSAFAAVGGDLYVAVTPAEIAGADAVVVPGAGAFIATRALEGGWTGAILARLGEGRPVFGIGLGMEWLFEGSDEAPDCPGLGLLAGQCVHHPAETRSHAPAGVDPFPDRAAVGRRATAGAANATDATVGRPDDPASLPDAGWLAITLLRDASIADGIVSATPMYYARRAAAPVTGDTVAVTTGRVGHHAAIVQRGQVVGVQFQPERSGEAGLRILRNFVELA
jgi:imidazole glycerol-phosphate synthase subunit HisH